jgi:hypothetical protein
MLRSAANGAESSAKAFAHATAKHPKIAQLHAGGAADYPYGSCLFFQHKAGGGSKWIETNMLISF